MSTLKSNLIEPATGTTLTLGAAGDTLTLSSDSIQTNLYKDAGANTILQSDGAGTLSNVNSALTKAGPKLLTTNNVTDYASTIEFSSNIDSTYATYMFIWSHIFLNAQNELRLEFQVGGSWGIEKMSQMWNCNRTSGGQNNPAFGPSKVVMATTPVNISKEMENGNTDGNGGILWLYKPSSTTQITNFLVQECQRNTSQAVYAAFSSGYLTTTGAVTGVRFSQGGGNIKGVIKMYGVI